MKTPLPPSATRTPPSPISKRLFPSSPFLLIPFSPLLLLPFSPLLLFTLFALLLAACTSSPPPSPSSPTALSPNPTRTPLLLPPTWTPGPPTASPLPPTPRPTYTFTPEPTLAPTLPPTATSFPPLRLATAADRPFTTFALLYLESGVIREWHLDGSVTDLVTLAGTSDRLNRVEMFDVSAGGGLVAILRRNAVGESEVVLFDRGARTIRWTTTLPVATPTALELSPDNLWLAFAGSGTGSQPGVIGTILVETPEQTLILGECQPSCVGLRWRPANGRVVWSDAAGIWEVDPLLGVAQTPEPLLEPPLQIINSGAENVTGVFNIMSFSPSGRYLLLSKGPIPDTIPTVFDIPSGRAADIPGSFLYTDPGLSVVWTADDKLAVARAGLAEEGRPGIEIWQVAPETESLLVREGISYVGNAASQAPFGLARLFDGDVRFGLLAFSTTTFTRGNGIYRFNPLGSPLEQLNDLPFIRVEQVLWVPDGTGVLMLTANKVYYIPTNGGFIYEMDAFLGASACCFAWAP